MKKIIEIPDAILKLSEQLKTQNVLMSQRPVIFYIKYKEKGRYKIAKNAYFLTNEEAEQYLKINKYKYKDAFVFVEHSSSQVLDTLLSFVESLTEEEN